MPSTLTPLPSLPHPRAPPGKFELGIAGGVEAYSAPRPQLVVLSSAAVERNAIIGDDAGGRGMRVCVGGACILHVVGETGEGEVQR